MRSSLSNEPDLAFGRTILTLRTTMGLTQAELAMRLGVSRRAVIGWESGISYPKIERIKELIALAIQHQAFPVGREEQEVRSLWKAAHQKVSLDEAWLSSQLISQRPPHPSQAPPPTKQTRLSTPPQESPHVDWGEAPAFPTFYGREQEQAQLTQWILHERCRLVSVLGMGGIGKSALVVHTMYQLAEHFQVVIFRSLRDAPSCETLLAECLQILSPQALSQTPPGLEQNITLLLQHLRTTRVLLVIDNLEALLSEGEIRGHLRPEQQGYARLLQQVAETAHQSCLLLTSREKPASLRALEDRYSPVRSLRLPGLDVPACQALLAEHELVGSQEEQAHLIQAYSGNPLALKIVAQTISDLFGEAIGPFLAQETTTFGISDLLDEQYSRLSSLERTMLSWLAILREPVNLAQVRSVLVTPLSPGHLLEALDGLRRRSLVEQGQRPGSLTLQSVVLEYVTARLITQATQEIQQSQLSCLIQHGFSLAHAKEYIRQAQERLLLSPLLLQVQSASPGQIHVERKLCSLLDQLRTWAREAQGYAPTNLVMLLRLLHGDLRGCDFSQLSLRGLSLQGVQMQDATLAGALIQDCSFTETFNATWAVVISSHGHYWAAGSRRGEIRVWENEGQTLHLVWQAHTDNIYILAFSPDERTLASGSWDRTVKLWDLEHGALLWTGWHTDSSVSSLAFAPDGRTLASSGDDATIRLWKTASGTPILAQAVPRGAVYSLVWSPDGKLLAHGCKDGSLHLWQIQTPRSIGYIQTLTGHTDWVLSLAFAPDSTRLVSGGWDGTVKLWDIPNGHVHQLQTQHTGRVSRVAWSPDGRTIAYATYENTIWLWDVEQDCPLAVLSGHTAQVCALVFTPNSQSLLSGGEDAILRLWDVTSGACLHTIEGYSVSFSDIDWCPNGSQIASADTNALVTLWDITGRTPPRLLHGHHWIVHGVAWSPNGQLLASSEWDNAIRLWNPATGQCLQILRNPDAVNTFFQGIAWSPDGQHLATSTYMEGVHVWDTHTGKRCWVGLPPPTKIRRVAWHPDGSQLASCGDDGSVCLWKASDGSLLQRLQKHQGMVAGVAWSPDGKLLASCGGGQGGQELLVWNVQHGERVQAFSGPFGIIWAVAWDPSANFLVSGDSDGMLRWWERESGTCMHVREAHQGAIQALKVSPDGQTLASCGDDGAITLWNLQTGEHLWTFRHDRPYERLDITGIQGLTQAQKATLLTLGAIDKGGFS